MFEVNDRLGQMVYGGRWPLVKRAACVIATDAIDSPFIFQIRNFDAPEAVAMDPVLARIWGPNDEAGAAILGRPCWNKLKGCLGKTVKVLSYWGSFTYPVAAFRELHAQIKRRNPEMKDDEAALHAFLGIVTDNPKPTDEKVFETAWYTTDGLNSKKLEMAKNISSLELWKIKQKQLIDHLKERGWWNFVERYLRLSHAASATAAAASGDTTSYIYYSLTPAEVRETVNQSLNDVKERVEEEEAAAAAGEEAAAGFDFSKLLIPAVAVGALLMLG
jgi:hypothetical protein